MWSVMQSTLSSLTEKIEKYMLLLHTILIRIFCKGLTNKKGTLYYRSRQFSLVNGKSANNFYIILSTHGHGLKQLALGGYSSGFVHLYCQWLRQVSLYDSYKLVGGHCYLLIFLKTLTSICYT